MHTDPFTVFPYRAAHFESIRDCNRLLERIRRDLELIQVTCEKQKEMLEEQRAYLAAMTKVSVKLDELFISVVPEQ